ncbi:MAG TPA: VOC family protein [Acidobacteriaceae bacterium]|nr:VOC family protein [Acidobacteriaceae bacterium]
MTFDHIAIYVTDIDRSAALYEQLLGLERIDEPFHDGLHVWLRIGPTLSLHIVGGAADTTPHDITHHMAFRTGSLDNTMLRLDRAGVVYRNFLGDGRINIRPDGIRQIYFQDPDGYWIEVNENPS